MASERYSSKLLLLNFPSNCHSRLPKQIEEIHSPTCPILPGPGNPPWISELTSADRIEQDLYDYGHRLWGFVIYRCTYQSNTAWTKFLRRLVADTEDVLEGADDLLDHLAITVLEDPGKFDGATAAVVREHFNQWAATAVEEEQGTTAQGLVPGLEGFQRYRYCIQVTQDELDSVLADDYERNGFLRMIWRDWKEYEPFEEDGERFEEEEEEPLEGCTLEAVGWMRVPFWGVMFLPWSHLRDPNAWYIEYRRPPAIGHF
ncbi:uncharacterized protein N7458_007827 [Penicillium daleae]|uniref:Uncharacterized protein n=1 Tax=Penicillium daleae TaxID=63821 RepID=A0AAD6C1U5_9EURO|nr:uncharacterized protein N7458_007827 [Penicillium daleae]KAJ5443955.1 hypothetical protein N7458_007827 [Penicillium daleae]